MRVKCINDYDDWNGVIFSNLTKGKVYEVITFTRDAFTIKSNNGKQITFNCDVYKNKFFEIIKEDKMENKIKIDDIVTLRTDITFQVPFGINKGTVLNVDLIEGDKARVSTPVVSFVVLLDFLIKVEEEKEIKEEVRVVRKLEDLDGLENGMGAYLKFNKNAKSVDVHEFRTESFITSRSVYNGDHMFLSVIKSMGFKFEYKPLRSLEEVIEEMRLKSLDRFGSYEYKLFSVGSINKNSSYLAVEANGHFVGEYLFNEETAQKYADELNEIIRGR